MYMTEFPIMAMREGDAVTVTEEWGTHHGTVMWWSAYEYWKVCVKLKDGSTRTFPDGPNRWAKFWH